MISYTLPQRIHCFTAANADKRANQTEPNRTEAKRIRMGTMCVRFLYAKFAHIIGHIWLSPASFAVGTYEMIIAHISMHAAQASSKKHSSLVDCRLAYNHMTQMLLLYVSSKHNAYNAYMHLERTSFQLQPTSGSVVSCYNFTKFKFTLNHHLFQSSHFLSSSRTFLPSNFYPEIFASRKCIFRKPMDFCDSPFNLISNKLQNRL